MLDDVRNLLDPHREPPLAVLIGPKPTDPVLIGSVGLPQFAHDPIQPCVLPLSFFFPRGDLSAQNFQSDQIEFRPLQTFIKMQKSEFSDILDSFDLPSFPEPFRTTDLQHKLFIDEVESLKQTFQSTDLKKAVPYAFAYAKRSPTRPEQFAMLRACIAQQEKSGGYVYAMLDAESGLLGLTPELLFERIGNRLETMALAGTRVSSPTARSELMNDSKEREEHQLVIQGISDALKECGPIKIAETTTRASAGLLHLETAINLENVTATFYSLLRRLHPTPALGGYPTFASLPWLSLFEKKNPRSKFGAPFAFRLPGQDICLVAIRGMEWSKDFCRIGAGCGVIAQSRAENEWRELNQKWASIAHCLGIKGPGYESNQL